MKTFRKNLLIGTFIFILSLSIGAGASLYFFKDNQSKEVLNSTIEQTKIAEIQNPIEKENQEVSVYENRMEPDVLTVKLGNSVQFNPKDGNTHKISYGQGNDHKKEHEHNEIVLDTAEVKSDEGYKVSFSKEGTYYFHDHDNPDAYITIVVYNPNGDYKIK